MPAAAAAADGGDVTSITWVAASPDFYDHSEGGGEFVNSSSGSHVRQLRGSDFACGDVVSFLAVIEMATGSANDPQTIEITNAFRADATVSSGVGFTDIMNISIDGSDPAQNNDGGSTIGVVSFGIDEDGDAPYFDSGDALTAGRDALFATYVIDDLESGETVVARVDVQLGCKEGASPAGNLTAGLAIAGIVADGTGTIDFDPAPGGEILVPLVAVDLVSGEANVPASGADTGNADSESSGGDLAEDPPEELPLTGDTANLLAMLGLGIVGIGMVALGSAHRKGLGA